MTHDELVPGSRARLFLGVPVAVKTAGSLGEAAEAMRRSAYQAGYQIRWVPPINYHVTIAFLGDCDPEIIGAITDRLAPRVGELSTFDFGVRGLGAFPKLERARVLWAGVHDPTDGLGGLNRVCADELEELGFAREQRAYHPHVTLGRVKRPDDLHSIVADNSERSFSKTRVEFVVLFESSMKSGTPRYVERARYALGQADPDGKRQTSTLQRGSDGASRGVTGQPDVADPEAENAPASAPDERT